MPGSIYSNIVEIIAEWFSPFLVDEADPELQRTNDDNTRNIIRKRKAKKALLGLVKTTCIYLEPFFYFFPEF